MSEKLNKETEHSPEETHMQKSIYTALRIGFIALLFVMSYLILQPFLGPVIWGIIIAVALFPLHKRFSRLLGNKDKLSASIIVFVGISLLLIPTILFTSSTIETVEFVAQQMTDGIIAVPPPNASVAEWPIIGKTIFETWELASKSLTSLLDAFAPQIKEMAPAILSMATGLVMTILLFIISLIIAGALLVNTEAAEKTAISVFKTLAGKEGEHFASLASATIRSVVQGVLGTAVIQTVFLSIGLFVVDFPAAEVVALVILFVAIIQLPVLLVMIPVIIVVFTYAGTTAAIIFTIWSILWSASDNVIKPILMGRGMDIPMLVILIGAIGGMMLGGIVGLFVGSVLLAFSYKIFQAIFQSS